MLVMSYYPRVLIDIPGFGGSCRDAHGTVTAVNALHLNQSPLLVRLIAETDKAVTTRLTGHSVGHNFGRLARREARLEQRDQDELIDLRAKIADENAIFGSTIITRKLSVER